ncbi:MAG TPA: precorrin-6A reductase [Clostridia bacterium]|nr:precorrin-6A reductase [Clostridia bacterium]
MKHILIFGGTADSHPLLEWLLRLDVQVTLCVTSDYARALLPPEDRLEILVGRLTAWDMAALMRSQRFVCVIDATHPYAKEVTRNIRTAARQSGLGLLRLLRPSSDEHGCIIVSSVMQAAARLSESTGRVLIATGSKELAAYANVTDFAERCYPRVLPTVEAIEQCVTLGFLQSHIIAMQGPFSQALNSALFKQLDIATLVTKDGGAAGGFPEKLAAAIECNIEVILVRRPEDTGDTLDQLKIKLSNILALE